MRSKICGRYTPSDLRAFARYLETAAGLINGVDTQTAGIFDEAAAKLYGLASRRSAEISQTSTVRHDA